MVLGAGVLETPSSTGGTSMTTITDQPFGTIRQAGWNSPIQSKRTRTFYTDQGGAEPGWYWQGQGSPVGPFSSQGAAIRDSEGLDY